MMNNQFYVYLHRRATDQSVFYVGKGKKKRAWVKERNNIRWNRVVKRSGIVVQIAAAGLVESRAFALEKELIGFFGRGNLTNQTDEGVGATGFKWSQEARENFGNRVRGPHHHLSGKPAYNRGRPMPQEQVEKMRGEKSHLYGKPGLRTGIKHTPESIEKNRLANLGSNSARWNPNPSPRLLKARARKAKNREAAQQTRA